MDIACSQGVGLQWVSPIVLVELGVCGTERAYWRGLPVYGAPRWKEDGMRRGHKRRWMGSQSREVEEGASFWDGAWESERVDLALEKVCYRHFRPLGRYSIV